MSCPKCGGHVVKATYSKYFRCEGCYEVLE